MNIYLKQLYIKHKNQILIGGIKVFLKKVLKILLSFHILIYFSIASIIFLIQRILSFFILIRIGRLKNHKLGHITVEIENYLNEKKLNSNNSGKIIFDIFYKEAFVSNNFFIKMRGRNIFIAPKIIFKELYYLNFILGKKYICGSQNGDRDIFNLLDQTKSNLIFSEDEVSEGKKFLNKIGVNNKPYVCLIVRDNAYFGFKPFSNYRNADIENFKKAINFLTSKGYYVIRMGAKVEKKLKLNNDKFFDYASSPLRNEFLDIFIGANCEFCLGTSTGFEGIPMCARKPTVTTNFVPIGYMPSWSKKSIVIFKHHHCKKTGKKLSLKDIINNGLCLTLDGKEYDHKGVDLIENTSEEILDATKEMYKKINNQWENSYEQNLLNNKFLSIYPLQIIDRDNQRLHGSILTQIGFEYLNKNNYFLKD